MGKIIFFSSFEIKFDSYKAKKLVIDIPRLGVGTDSQPGLNTCISHRVDILCDRDLRRGVASHD